MADPRSGRGRRLPRARRITQGSEIRALFKRGKRSRTPHLDVLVADSPLSFSRVGTVVPKHGNTAVDRNRLKRRLREVLRTELVPFLDEASLEVDVLVRARREAYQAGFREISDELRAWREGRWRGSSSP